jgi:hypothetical protein
LKQWEEDQSVDTPVLSKMIQRAQKKVEMHNFDARKHVLEYDDVMNVQRDVIYRERRKILEGADLRDTLVGYLHEAVDHALGLYCPEGVSPEEWDRSGLYENLNAQFPLARYLEEGELDGKSKAEISERLHEIADQAYADKEAEFGPEIMREIERHITIRQIDQAWIYHLANMDYLREGIGLRGYAQVDPLVAYKKEAFQLFEEMQAGIQGDVIRNLFLASIQFGDQPEESMYHPLASSARTIWMRSRRATAAFRASPTSARACCSRRWPPRRRRQRRPAPASAPTTRARAAAARSTRSAAVTSRAVANQAQRQGGPRVLARGPPFLRKDPGDDASGRPGRGRLSRDLRGRGFQIEQREGGGRLERIEVVEDQILARELLNARVGGVGDRRQAGGLARRHAPVLLARGQGSQRAGGYPEQAQLRLQRDRAVAVDVGRDLHAPVLEPAGDGDAGGFVVEGGDHGRAQGFFFAPAVRGEANPHHAQFHERFARRNVQQPDDLFHLGNGFGGSLDSQGHRLVVGGDALDAPGQNRRLLRRGRGFEQADQIRCPHEAQLDHLGHRALNPGAAGQAGQRERADQQKTQAAHVASFFFGTKGTERAIHATRPISPSPGALPARRLGRVTIRPG